MKTNAKKVDLVPIPSQTVGPYFQIAMAGSRLVAQIAGPNAKGERVKLVCTVFDGKGGKFADVYLPSNRRIWEPLSAPSRRTARSWA